MSISVRTLMAGWLALWVGLVWLWLAVPARANELDARVSVQTPGIQGADPTIFQQMQMDISKYLVDTKWTNDQFLPVERIRLQINIIIQRMPTPSRFEGSMQVQVIRPVFNSTFETVIFNYNDQSIAFDYVPFQPIIFNENQYVNNLTSLLNYYAFIALGVDYNSFGLEAGIPFFDRARNAAQIAQNGQESGWNAMDGTQARYWLSENLLNNSYKKYHSAMYTYHRQGLDIMHNNVNEGRQNILVALQVLQQLFVSNPNMLIIPNFMVAKRQELINIFRNALPEDKTRLLNIVAQLDPANKTKYDVILQEANK